MQSQYFLNQDIYAFSGCVVEAWFPSNIVLDINNIKWCSVSPISTNNRGSGNRITRGKVDPWEIVRPYICHNLKCFFTYHEFTIHRQSKESTTWDWSKPGHITPLMQHRSDLPYVRRSCNYGPLRSNSAWFHPLQLSLSRCDNFPWRCFVAPTEPHWCSTACNAVRHTHHWCLQ